MICSFNHANLIFHSSLCYNNISDVYQLGLQSASSLLSDIECSDTLTGNLDQALRDSLFNVLGSMIEEGPDFDWICQAILTSLCTQ